MKKELLQAVLLPLLSLALLSCSNERKYDIVVKNETTYILNKVKFGCGDTGTEVAVGANNVSTPFTISFKKGIGRPFTEPLLCSTVLSYSDSNNTYDNTRGRVISESSLKEGATNFILIELEPNQTGTVSFSFRVE